MINEPGENAGAEIRFAAFVLNVGTLELCRGDERVHLPPQPARILALLASQPGRLVTREEIRQAVWGDDVHVEFDRALNFAIKQIRTALGDDPRAPRFVETLRSRGYRFLVPASASPGDSPAAKAALMSGSALARPVRWLLPTIGIAAALTVAATLGVLVSRQLSPAAPVAHDAMLAGGVEPEAYELYLKARHFWNRRGDGATLAASYFSRAIARDPTFALAHAGLGDAYMSLPEPNFRNAEASARKALALDPELPEAQLTLAHVLMHRLEWDEARRQFEQAVGARPQYPPVLYIYGEYLLAANRTEEAVARAKTAAALDPLSGIAAHAYGTVLYFARRYEEAAAQFRQAIELEPTHQWSRRRLGLALMHMGRCSEATRHVDAGGREWLEAALVRAHCGRTAEARALLEVSPMFAGRPFTRAMVWTALGETDRAMEALEEATAAGVYDLTRLQVEPALDPLRSDQRFSRLAERVGPAVHTP